LSVFGQPVARRGGPGSLETGEGSSPSAGVGVGDGDGDGDGRFTGTRADVDA
jgi:hypothetical protein